MARKIIDNKLANEFGKDYVKVMVDLLRNNRPYPKVASGSLINSINYRLQETAVGVNLVLVANDYLTWVDRGRRPGTYPPIQAIQRWAQIKGIPKEAAWAIRQNIYKFGIKPTRVIAKTRFTIETNRKYVQNMRNPLLKLLQNKLKRIGLL